jgi:hypothetical protein
MVGLHLADVVGQVQPSASLLHAVEDHVPRCLLASSTLALRYINARHLAAVEELS